MRLALRFLVVFLVVPLPAFPQGEDVRSSMVASAVADGAGYEILGRICDRAGGRLAGTEGNRRALDLLESELHRLNLKPGRQRYTAPGWERGDDRVELTAPFHRRLRAIALGFTHTHPQVSDTVIAVGPGTRSSYQGKQVRGKIVLVSSALSPLLRLEAIDTAFAGGARAVLFSNDKPGGLVLAGVSNFQGSASPIPAYSLTLEEGLWLQRLLESGATVVVTISTFSRCLPQESENLILTFPGEDRRKIVIGAHVDSWDLGQGALDNGLGTAIVYDVARLLGRWSRRNRLTVELVWFNGEETGLQGSQQYLSMQNPDDIAAMVNLDMTGAPTGFNAMGFDEHIPLLRRVAGSLRGFDFRDSVISVPGTNSDHQPFLLAGIPCFSINGSLDAESVRYYHDLGDTFDKVNRRDLGSAAAVAAVLIHTLANADPGAYVRRSPAAVDELLKKFGVDERLRRQKQR